MFLAMYIYSIYVIVFIYISSTTLKDMHMVGVKWFTYIVLINWFL